MFTLRKTGHRQCCVIPRTLYEEHDYFLWGVMDMACIVSKEGHLELKTAGPLMSDPKEFVGSSALASFPLVRYGLSFMVFQCHNSESTYWAGDTLLHVHIHLSQISAQKSKEGTTHARKTSKLFVDTFQQLPPFKSALQLTCNPC